SGLSGFPSTGQYSSTLVPFGVDSVRERAYIGSMFQSRVSSTVAFRSLLLFAICILLPAWAQASDFGLEGGSGCSDPPIFSQIFTFTVNSHGGFCTGFGNHSGVNFDSLRFVTTLPSGSPMFHCFSEPFFANCGFTFDTAHNTVTIDFFG